MTMRLPGPITRTLAPLVVGLLACSGALAADNELIAAKVAAPPKLDGAANDPAWSAAKPLTVRLLGGENFDRGRTTATLKAVYTSDTLYLLIQYDDPTQSVRRSPYVKQADGSWKKLADPDDKGGDNNKYYEDKWAIIWSIGNSIQGFDKEGCAVACHTGEPGKPFGNKYTAKEGELGDIWHMKSVRGGVTLGQPDDQYLDHTRFDAEKSPEAGRKSDPRAGGGYADVKLVNGRPEFMAKDAKPANKGGTYWLKDEDKVAFDDGKFVAGDEVASILIAPFTGDRGDLQGAGTWAQGKWTYEVARKLVTGSKFDVQFGNLAAGYPFGFAAFDNAQVRHAVHPGVLVLKFAQ